MLRQFLRFAEPSRRGLLSSRFGEAIAVGDVVYGVDDVERVHARGVNVYGDGRLLAEIWGVVEDEAVCRLHRRHQVLSDNLEGNSVVAARIIRCCCTVVVPAQRRGYRILRVAQELKSLSRKLLCDR